VWLALALSAHQHHATARDWLETVGEPASVTFCRATHQSFLRLLTNSTVLGAYGNPPLSNREAWEVCEAFLSDDRIVLQTKEPPDLEIRWRELSSCDTASPKLWMDAYLAAFATAGGYRMVTTDHAFRQFPDLDLLVLGART
jgi:toxin-antitoxin system PIN domain toxin